MRLYVSLLALMSVTACSVAPDAHSSRSSTTFAFAEQSKPIDAQAQALENLSSRIVVQTTLKGAGIGAAVGCGLAVVSVGGAQHCVAAAAAGAAGGALIGHRAGKRKVEREISAISPSAVVRTIRRTNDQMALIQTSLPARLAAHEDALSQLDLLRATGQMDARAYAAARASIADEREAIALALIETQSNASQAEANLRAAKDKGQSGLDWHIGAASKLSREASSARSSITLL